MSETNDRKMEHIRIIQEDPATDRTKYFFEQLQLKHRALPEIDLAEVDPSITFLKHRLSFPLLISSMTGGDHDVLRKVNRQLAEAAEACGVAMGVGSQRVMFEEPAAAASFDLRSYAPSTLLFANLGAVQLNCGYGLDECRRAVEVLGADALILHLNPLQEAVQPEGDTCFAGLVDRIAEVVQQLGKPVIVKEVGAGISDIDAELLFDAGVRIIDVAGSGGTSWSRIEHYRKPQSSIDDLGVVFQDWGIPTPLGLQHLRPWQREVELIASGGVRSGIDMVKAVVLGASLCGMARPFLEAAMESTARIIETIEQRRREFVTAMFLTGTPDIDHLKNNHDLLLH